MLTATSSSSSPTTAAATPTAFGSPSGHVFIVGASRGIGHAFVKHLLATPAVTCVYAGCRHPDQAIALQQLQAMHPDRLVIVTIDITDEAQVIQALESIKTRTPRLQLVINCVGVLHDGAWQPEKSLRQINADQLLQYFQVNSIGSILLAKHLPALLKHDQLSIFATISAKVGSIGDNQLGGWYGYRASKAALNMLMKTAAIEYKRTCPQTIIALLHPGTTATDLSQPFQSNVPPEKLFSPEHTVQLLLAVLAPITRADSGEFFSWNGDRLPW
jgi:NAD(P)-dependent dehydrogenase (short-subunit alcohol dehydrogenase family)